MNLNTSCLTSKKIAFKLIYGFLLYITKYHHTSTASSTIQGNETDLQALLDFKTRITQDPFHTLSSWNHSIHHCNWLGITCNISSGRVIHMILPDMRLAGTLSPSIGNLTYLTKLNLRNSSFHGKFPQQVGNLLYLQHINISYNSFGGTIPSNLSNCLELSILSSGHNNFTGTIPSWIGNFSSLSLLNLAVNNFHGTIPDEVGKLSRLTLFAINGNYLYGKIPTSIFNISSLYFLTFTENNLHGSLPSDVGFTLPNLEIFAGGVNRLTGTIPESLSNASRLEILDFAENGLIGTLPKNIGRLKLLTRLNFDSNRLGNGKDGDLDFITSLINCTVLEVLGLAENNFGGELPKSIGNLSTQLNELDLGTNAIYGSVPFGISNLVNLTSLGLGNNFLSGFVPYTIGKLRNLVDLELYNNSFSGVIPSSIGNLNLLTVLLIGDNNFEGSIPESIGNCRNLLQLNLSHNKLNGTVPRHISSLSSLSIYLDLSHNALIGSLPFEVGELVNLEELDLSNNKLSGAIPSSLGSCASLEGLHMQGNFFEGNIPSSIQNLRGIQDIDLSCNNLSGKVPEFLGEIKGLMRVNLSYNDFEGELPMNSIFQNTTLFSIDGNIKLCGGVSELNLPSCSVEKLHSPKVIILIASALVFALFLSCFVAIIMRKISGKKTSRERVTAEEYELNISYSEIVKWTSGFSEDNLIGKGSFGSVYKAILLRDETIIAIKVLNLEQIGASKSFIDECNVLKIIRHRNLLKIITAISGIDHKGNDFKALVYEFMSNGCLEDWLHPKNQTKTLSFVKRLNIAIDVACALEYLHHSCETPIVHCDIKPSNVLLDKNMVAHVGDFGLATFLFEESCDSTKYSTVTANLKGSIGYIAPEYGMGGRVSAVGDVYSYGILLLEIFTGKRPTDEMFEGGIGIQQFTALALPNHVIDIIDPSLLLQDEELDGYDEDYSEEIALRYENEPRDMSSMEKCLVCVLEIGVSCSSISPSERMHMNEVVHKLQAIKNSYLRLNELS